ncbi:uncharacterized protein LOC142519743 [Primulina tabacum]|uniref:uncharacterized protein LOC142519743 n=1 Tax=Primulina tabacum TaxID=48773 RepID=UPI003F5A2570
MALVIMARRLRPYFLSHPIIVFTNSALGKIISHPYTSGRLIKWVTELSEYDINFELRTVIKAQACRLSRVNCSSIRGRAMEDLCRWFFLSNGEWGRSRDDISLVAVRLNFRASNNEDEYEALLVGLRAARSMGVTLAVLYSDSQLIIQQCLGKFEVKNEKMVRYVQAIEKAKEDFTKLIMKQISRTQNEKADRLAKMANSLAQLTGP